MTQSVSKTSHVLTTEGVSATPSKEQLSSIWTIAKDKISTEKAKIKPETKAYLDNLKAVLEKPHQGSHNEVKSLVFKVLELLALISAEDKEHALKQRSIDKTFVKEAQDISISQQRMAGADELAKSVISSAASKLSVSEELKDLPSPKNASDAWLGFQLKRKQQGFTRGISAATQNGMDVMTKVDQSLARTFATTAQVLKTSVQNGDSEGNENERITSSVLLILEELVNLERESARKTLQYS